MTHHQFENYLTLVSRLLRQSLSECDVIADELRDHLESRFLELKAAGHTDSEAARKAVEEFGDAAALAQQFELVSKVYYRRWIMRFTTLCTAGVFLGLVFLMAMWPDNARFGSPDQVYGQNGIGSAEETSTQSELLRENIGLSDTTRRNRKIDDKLVEPAEWNFKGVAFQDVREVLAKRLEVNVFLDQSAEDDSLMDDEVVTFQATNLPGREALKMMLKKYNATYVVKRGVICVISRDVATSPEYFRRKIFNCQGILKSDQGCGEEELIGLIKKVVDPENWSDVHGEASVTVVSGLLVVLATESMLDQIGDLLRDLEWDMNRVLDERSKKEVAFE